MKSNILEAGTRFHSPDTAKHATQQSNGRCDCHPGTIQNEKRYGVVALKPDAEIGECDNVEDEDGDNSLDVYPGGERLDTVWGSLAGLAAWEVCSSRRSGRLPGVCVLPVYEIVGL